MISESYRASLSEGGGKGLSKFSKGVNPALAQKGEKRIKDMKGSLSSIDQEEEREVRIKQ